MEKPIARIEGRPPPPKKKTLKEWRDQLIMEKTNLQLCNAVYCNINPPPLKKLAPSGLDLYRIT
jgi:hypothetical protein